MSGLAGYVVLSGDPAVAGPRCRMMLEAMRHRGPHGASVHAEPGLSLGHAWLDTGDEPGPWRLRNDGPVLTGEIRLDAPEDLAGALGLAGASDAALVLAAYDRWGVDCLSRIDGDFAFALWDPALRRLFCARDRFGVKPFVFRVTPQGFAFASEITPLRTAFGVAQPAEPDDIWIAEFLSGQPTCATRTAWRGITRLEPGHLLLLEAGRVEIRLYWSLDPAPRQIADGPEAVRDALDRAVASRMRGGPVGAMLSGGLDSSSIAVLAARHGAQPLPVFSLVFENQPELDERRYIAASQAIGGFDQHWIAGGTGGALDDAEASLTEQEQPFDGFGLPTTRGLYAAAAKAGMRALLDGHGGDEVISTGVTRLREMARAGQFGALWQQVGGAASLHGESRLALFLEIVSAHAANRVPRGLARRLRGGGTPDRTAWRRMVHADLTDRTALVDRVRGAAATPVAGQTEDMRQHISPLANPAMPAAFEILDRAAARQGVEPRYPFFDRRLVELCVAQPASAKFHDGMSRALLRDAMQGVLPDAVRLRPDKTEFSANLRRSLLDDPSDRLGRLSDPRSSGPVADMVNMAELRAGIDRLRQGKADHLTVTQVWRAIWLAEWLERLDTPQLATNDRRNRV